MKYIYTFAGVLLLPLIIVFDFVLFFGSGSKVTCLNCDLSEYFRTSSLSLMVLSQAWNLVKKV